MDSVVSMTSLDHVMWRCAVFIGPKFRPLRHLTVSSSINCVRRKESRTNLGTCKRSSFTYVVRRNLMLRSYSSVILSLSVHYLRLCHGLKSWQQIVEVRSICPVLSLYRTSKSMRGYYVPRAHGHKSLLSSFRSWQSLMRMTVTQSVLRRDDTASLVTRKLLEVITMTSWLLYTWGGLLAAGKES